MKKFSTLKNENVKKYESSDVLGNDIYSLIENTLNIKVLNEKLLDSNISIDGYDELVEGIKTLINNIRLKERILTLEHVKANVHRNFDMKWLNEQIDTLNDNYNNYYKDLSAKDAIGKATMDLNHAKKVSNDGLVEKITSQLKEHLEKINYDWKKDPHALEILGDYLN